jgi:p-cumate 2,3-dioxygenase subunit alpha
VATTAHDRADMQGFEAVPHERIVDNRVYHDPEVFELERERIFERIWLPIGHESELREPGDFLSTRVVGSEILVTRADDGQLHAFYNVCRHRGALVVMEERGHAACLRCPYHFWAYRLDGSLMSIPGEEAYDGTGFDKDRVGLVPVHVATAHGIMFVSLAEQPEPLESWLGPSVMEVLAKPLAGADFEVVGSKQLPTKANWKVFAENARDGYHVPFVHPFFRKASPPGTYRLLDNGHAVQELGVDPKGIEPELWDKIRRHPFPGVGEGEGYIVNVFPDMAITLRSNMISIDFQRFDGPDAVVMENRTLGLAGDSDEVREIRRLSQDTWFFNPVELEDHPIFEAQQRGVSSRGVRYSVIARGEDKTSGTRGDDNRLRYFWVKWRELMGTAGNGLA